MAKIFQLEFFIKEMSLSELPNGSEEHDETCVEVTVFGNQNVPINGYVFGKNSTMNQGQNFLFTLSAMPICDNQVFFNIFKKAYNREKKFLGNGNIPIFKIFGELFSQVLKKNAQATDQTQNPDATIVGSEPNPQNAQNNPTNTANAAQTAPNGNPSQTTADANATSKNNPKVTNPNKTQNQATAAKQSPQTTKANANASSKKDPKDANQNKTQNQPTDAKQIPQQTHANANETQNHGNTNVGSTNESKDVNQNAAIPAIKNLKSVNVASTTPGSPISRLSKDVYPIIGCDSKQWGTICILMRLTCFGHHSAQPIVIHQNHKEIILQNTPKSATYKCVPLQQSKNRDDPHNKRMPKTRSSSTSGSNLATSSSSSSSSSSNSNATTNVLKFNASNRNTTNHCTDIAKSNLTSSSSSSSTNAPISRPNAYSDPCPGPPGSPSGKYEEFTAEINGNVLCIRVPKNVGSVKRIYDNEDSLKQPKYFDRRKIPIIRGNRKYPAHYGTMSSLPSSRNSTIFDQRKIGTDYSFESRNFQDDNVSCPSNVQITRRNNDPNRDVFLLDFGKNGRSGNGIQLEMKTPKNPLARSVTSKQTTSVQTYDDEFVGGAKKGGGGRKKGGKKGKN